MDEKKILTDDGIVEDKDMKGVDKAIDISIPEKKEEVPKQPIKPLPQQSRSPPETKKEMIKRWNDHPISRQHRIRAIKKGTYIGLWSLAGFVVLLMMIGMIWGITTFKNKDFAPIVNNDHTINVDSPNVTVPIENNYTTENINNINITIEVGDELAETIASQVLDIINNETNNSG